MSKGVRIVLYTDGSCHAKHTDKLGGYGYRWELWDEDTLHQFQEGNAGFKNTTISRMEARAIIFGLSSIPYTDIPVYIVADSEYLCKAMQDGRMVEWANAEYERNRENRDLYRQLVLVSGDVTVKRVIHVRGHGKEKIHTWAIEGNKRADKLADYRNFTYYHDDKRAIQ